MLPAFINARSIGLQNKKQTGNEAKTIKKELLQQ